MRIAFKSYDKLVSLSSLKANKFQRNRHPKEQIERLAKIMREHGVRHPIHISTRSKQVCFGHGRWEAAKLNGWDKYPVVYQDFKSAKEEFACVQSDNAIASWAELDRDSLQNDLKDFANLDIDLLGIKDFEISEKFEAKADEDAIPEKVDTRVKLGDVWQLGRHRLMCGDSTSVDSVEKLMAGERADMVFTDPPYGVDYDGGAQTKRKKLENDHSTDIYSDVLPVLHAFMLDEAALYVWHAAGYADMASKLGDAGFKIRSQIIWNKNQAQFGALSAQYKQKHEPCFYSHKKGCSPKWYGPTNEVTVWDLNREKKNEFHPTQKPVELAERALENSSKNSDSVLDLFGGSGSTLIACEKTNRRCFMMELDPHYCDVILTRWENYTGKTAERVNGKAPKTKTKKAR